MRIGSQRPLITKWIIEVVKRFDENRIGKSKTEIWWFGGRSDWVTKRKGIIVRWLEFFNEGGFTGRITKQGRIIASNEKVVRQRYAEIRESIQLNQGKLWKIVERSQKFGIREERSFEDHQ